MILTQELLPGTQLFKLKRLEDARGYFVKSYARSLFDAAGAPFDFAEEFYSVSAKDVIRGMHFQTPPHDHVKIVCCAVGSVLDVMLDLRKGPGFARSANVVLRADEPSLLVIPKGIAHGFRSLEDGSLMVYKTSTEYVPEHDLGIHWNSFGFDWGMCVKPVVSTRDDAHLPLQSYLSPFSAPGKS